MIDRFPNVPVPLDLYCPVNVLVPFVNPVTTNVLTTDVKTLPLTLMLRESEAARVVAPETENDMNDSVPPTVPLMSAETMTRALFVEIVAVTVGPVASAV